MIGHKSTVPPTPRLFHLTVADLARGMGIPPAALRVFIDRGIIVPDERGRFSLPAATAALAIAVAEDAKAAAAQARAVGIAAERFSAVVIEALAPVLLLSRDPTLPDPARELVRSRCDDAVTRLQAAAEAIVDVTKGVL
jgi:hypothetical protein